MKFEIKIPKGVAKGDLDSFGNMCKHYDCELEKSSRYSNELTISSEDPTNFFWLGANSTNF